MMNKESTCCFTGPRPARLPALGNEFSAEIIALKKSLKAAVYEAYNEGYRFFITGMAEGFDLFAAEAVIELKDEDASVGLIAALPYKEAPLHHDGETVKRIDKILRRCDLVYSLFDEHIPGCELSRNRFMVDRSSRIIGYYNAVSPGTAHCWGYALENDLERVNLYESNL